MKLNKLLKIVSSFILIFNIIPLYVHIKAEEINLHLYKIGFYKTTVVESENPISILRQKGGFTCNEELKFIFNGQILNEKSSFKDYNIKNGDIIVILECKKDPLGEWLNLAHDAERLSNAIRSHFDPTYRKENKRLKDLCLLRNENKLEKLRVAPTRSVPHYWPDRVERSENIALTNLKYEPKLSEEPLPPLW